MANYLRRWVRDLKTEPAQIKFVTPGTDLVVEHVEKVPKIMQTVAGEIYVLADKTLLHVAAVGQQFELQIAFRLDYTATGEVQVSANC